MFKDKNFEIRYDIWENHHPERTYRTEIEKEYSGLPFYVYFDDGMGWNTISNKCVVQIQNNHSMFKSKDVFYLSVEKYPVIVKGICKLSKEDYGRAVWFVSQNEECFLKAHSHFDYGYFDLIKEIKKWDYSYETWIWNSKYPKTPFQRLKERLAHNNWIFDYLLCIYRNHFPDIYFKYKVPNLSPNVYIDVRNLWKNKNCIQVQNNFYERFEDNFWSDVYSKDTFFLSIEEEPKVIKGKCKLQDEDLNNIKKFIVENKEFLLSIDEEKFEERYFETERTIE